MWEALKKAKLESGINGTSALLTGFLRCAVCGGGLAHVRKNNKSKRYYCVERSRRGATVCSNSAGVPMKALDDHVLVALNEALTDEDQVWDLITERANRWKREHERPKKERENIERQLKRIEGEIANLTRQAARGLDIDVQEFNSRRAQVEELRRKLEAPAEIELDRDALRAGLTMLKHFKGGLTLIDDPSKDYIEMKLDPVVGPLATKRDPASTRSALRKLGVERIAVKPASDGWDFEGLCNLSRLVSNKGASAHPHAPPGCWCASRRSARYP